VKRDSHAVRRAGFSTKWWLRTERAREAAIAATSRGTIDEAFFVKRVEPLLKEPA